MKKHKKIIAVVATVGFLMPCIGGLVNAASYYDYNATVPTFADYESSPKKKETTGSAYNKVQSVQKGKTLVSWVENTSGTNLTSKATYSTTGTKTMDYKGNASQYKGKNVRLNISTSATTLSSATTKGEWTPN